MNVRRTGSRPIGMSAPSRSAPQIRLQTFLKEWSSARGVGVVRIVGGVSAGWRPGGPPNPSVLAQPLRRSHDHREHWRPGGAGRAIRRGCTTRATEPSTVPHQRISGSAVKRTAVRWPCRLHPTTAHAAGECDNATLLARVAAGDQLAGNV
jgi:hypothetical protein